MISQVNDNVPALNIFSINSKSQNPRSEAAKHLKKLFTVCNSSVQDVVRTEDVVAVLSVVLTPAKF